MGGWRKGRGRLLRLADNGHGKPEVLLSKLDEPNVIIPGPIGSLYISSLGKIFLFDPKTGNTRDIIVNLPSTGRHPLSALAAAPDGSLFINVGSATDHCEKDNGDPPDPTAPCPETLVSPGRGTILHIMPTATPIDARQLHSYASGLRNSMALAVLPSGQLYAAVNSRDAINQADPSLSDEELPHDTLDRIEPGADYGWPYCFDSNRPSPEYSNFDCTAKHLPNSLLPAHAAPLGMLFYKGALLTGFDDHLIIAYHGYRANGHRLVKVGLDAKELPTSFDEIVSGWDAAPGRHPQGAPVGIYEMDDGSILMVEDQNGTLLRLSRDK